MSAALKRLIASARLIDHKVDEVMFSPVLAAETKGEEIMVVRTKMAEHMSAAETTAQGLKLV